MIAFLASICAVAIWIYLLLGRGKFWLLREMEVAERPAPRRVAVIIPARNEAKTIRRALASLTEQNHPGPWHIYVWTITAKIARQKWRGRAPGLNC